MGSTLDEIRRIEEAWLGRSMALDRQEYFEKQRLHRESQYKRLKLVMTPEAAQAFQKPRCADCGKPLQGDEQSQETADGALCESCLEDHGGGVTCDAPKAGDIYEHNHRQYRLTRFEHGSRGAIWWAYNLADLTKSPIAIYDLAPMTRVRIPASEPKIEQKPFCACCSAQAYGVADWRETDGKEPIRHDDPCQFSHTERWMLPKAKAMFRAKWEQMGRDVFAAEKRRRDLEELAGIEGECIGPLGVNGARTVSYGRGKDYSALTGHRWEAGK